MLLSEKIEKKSGVGRQQQHHTNHSYNQKRQDRELLLFHYERNGTYKSRQTNNGDKTSDDCRYTMVSDFCLVFFRR
jgi:hypothetical protein